MTGKKTVAKVLSIVLAIATMAQPSSAFAASEENTKDVVNSTNILQDDTDFEFPSESELEALESEENTRGMMYTTLGVGRHYLGYFQFTDTNTGAIRTYNGSKVRICLAWKSADSGGDVDIETTLTKISTGGYTWKKFRCSEDGDGTDANGYYYVVGPWTTIDSWGRDMYIFYDAVTREGYTPPGYLRSAHVHTWVDIQ